MLTNNVAFQVGDIVCLKEVCPTPLGESKSPSLYTTPMQVIRIMPDKDWEQRVGECGNSNLYACRALIGDHLKSGMEIMNYQYQLTLWKNRRQDVLDSITMYLTSMWEIGHTGLDKE